MFDAGTGKSAAEPQLLQIFCRGEDFDDGFWRDNGHFEVNLGFEHLFTGHAGLLGLRPGPKPAPQSPEESRFLEAMAWPENLEKYQRQTRENIRKLQDWVRRIEASLPVGKTRLWSEGEDNFRGAAGRNRLRALTRRTALSRTGTDALECPHSSKTGG